MFQALLVLAIIILIANIVLYYYNSSTSNCKLQTFIEKTKNLSMHGLPEIKPVYKKSILSADNDLDAKFPTHSVDKEMPRISVSEARNLTLSEFRDDINEIENMASHTRVQAHKRAPPSTMQISTWVNGLDTYQ